MYLMKKHPKLIANSLLLSNALDSMGDLVFRENPK